jgi:hypothetical protein
MQPHATWCNAMQPIRHLEKRTHRAATNHEQPATGEV